MKYFIYVFALLTAAFSQAATQVTTAKMTKQPTMSTTGFRPYVGTAFGYTNYSETRDVEGVPANLKLLGSYYFSSNPLVADLGFGLNQHQFAQTAVREKTISGTQAEAAMRYQFSNNWQAGAIATVDFNQGKNFYARQGDMHMVGAQVLKEWSFSNSWLLRTGARLMSGTNTEAGVNMAMLDLQIGWAPEKTAPVKMAQKTAPATTLSTMSFRRELNFASNQSNISQMDANQLGKLAAKVKNTELFGKMEIIGHTDSTGSTEKNQQLSLDRANAVKALLMNAGMSEDKLVATGKGEKEVRADGGNEASRRVEIRFIDVKNQNALNDILNSIQ